MRAMRLSEYRPAEQDPLELTEVPVPEPGSGEICIRINLCGVCHTDLHTVEGDIHPPELPITPGHQVVGQVEALGAGVEKFEVGDRVGVPWLYETDGTCEFCRRGMENLCPNARFTGFHVDGG
jgi:propanol-preferring alcohol dehydrogenase